MVRPVMGAVPGAQASLKNHRIPVDPERHLAAPFLAGSCRHRDPAPRRNDEAAGSDSERAEAL